MLTPLIINSQAGIKRDGTQFEGNFYIDGQWVRFQRNLPRKINGYVSINSITEICRGIRTYTQNNQTYVHSGSANLLQQFILDEAGNSSPVYNRELRSSSSNLPNLATNDANLWQFDILYDALSITGQGNKLIAQIAPNGTCVCNNQGGQIYVGDLTSTAPLYEVPIPLGSSATGGVTVLHPYAIYFGNDGFLNWSAPGRPNVFYLFEYRQVTNLNLQFPIFAGQKKIYFSPTDVSSSFTVNEVITFAPPGINPVNFPVTIESIAYVPGGSGVATGSVNLTLTSAINSAINVDTPIQIAATTNLATTDPIILGATSFTVNGDQTAVFTTNSLISFGTSDNFVFTVANSVFPSGGTVTTVNLTTTVITSYPANTTVYKFTPSPKNTSDFIAVGQTQFFVNAIGATKPFAVGQKIYMASALPTTILNSYQLSGVDPVNVTILTLATPLLQAFATGSLIYKQDATVSTGAGNARVANQKIVKGLPLRGGPGNAPSGLFWSADALIRMSFVGGAQTFQFDTISSQISVLSAASVIEYDGVYYWLGTDRFLMFNGVVRDLPNVMNINWFFDNLNRAQASKCFAFKVPRYGEIWWCAPLFNATECSHAIIYNTRENSWYDTKLPNGGRSAGEFASVFSFPLLTGVDYISFNNISGFKTWRHEVGYDEIDGTNISPIDSYFETADFSFVAQPQNGKNKAVRIAMLEPDFVQNGDMTVQLTGRANARSAQIYGELKTLYAEPSIPDQQILYFKEQYRELRFLFRSNTLGGSYQMGQCIAYIEEGDGTILGPLSINN